MRCEDCEHETLYFNEFADNLAAQFNFPSYNEDTEGTEKISEKSVLDQLSKVYGKDLALKIYIAFYIATSISTGFPAEAFGQSDDVTNNERPPVFGLPLVEVADVEIPEVMGSNVEAGPSEDLYVENLDNLKDVIRGGLSTKIYRLNVPDVDTYMDVLRYLRDNKVFFTTGNKMEAVTPDLLKEVFGDEYNFMLINDTQGVMPVNEIASFYRKADVLPDEYEVTEHNNSMGDGLQKQVITEVDAKGNVTETVKYTAPWNYTAGKTTSGDALSYGRMFLATNPTMVLVNPEDPSMTQTYPIYSLSTGGYITESGLFISNFEYEPIFYEGVGQYHGAVIGQNVLGATKDIQNLVVINADGGSYSMLRNDNFPMYFIKMLSEANENLGTEYKVVITESISNAMNNHNSLLKNLEQKGINYEDFVFTFASAGNSNKLLLSDTNYPQNAAQVVALTQDQKALTSYTNYGLDEEKLVGEVGTFYAVYPVINELGQLVFEIKSYTGTSMSTPIIASGFMVEMINKDWANSNILDSFDYKDIIWNGELSGGYYVPNIAQISDVELNRHLATISENGSVLDDAILKFDANWMNLNGPIYKSPHIETINMNWIDFVNGPENFTIQRTYTFGDFYINRLLSDIWLIEKGIQKPLIERENLDAIDRIAYLESIGLVVSPIVSPRFGVSKVYKRLRTGSGILPQVEIEAGAHNQKVYFSNLNLIRERFDPDFGKNIEIKIPPEENDSGGYVLYFPFMAKN